jgi:orotate phosphoribosyltransferase
MAKVKLNSILTALEGSVQGLKFYKKGKETIASPQGDLLRKKRQPSEKEMAGQIRMRIANAYSKGIKANHPELYARYVAVSKQQGSLPFTVSNRDYNNPPVVDAIDSSAYRGALGQVIRIRAHDDFEVRDVTVTIRTGDTPIESGLGIRQLDESWHYTSTATAIGTVTIEATARDWPDHKASKTIKADLTAAPVADDSPRSHLVQQIRTIAQRRGSYLLKNGETRVNYFDKYRLSHSPTLLREIAAQFVPHIPHDTDALAGLETGGIPLATVLSQLTCKPLVLLRKAPRDWGTTLPAEGGDLAGRHVLMIADVVTTGQQLATSARHLRAAGAIVTHVVCILDEQSGASGLLQKQGLSLTSLFTRFELIA